MIYTRYRAMARAKKTETATRANISMYPKMLQRLKQQAKDRGLSVSAYVSYLVLRDAD
jgi:predicted DNA binding CopG/RHH family protein